jgi:hypothetical protein
VLQARSRIKETNLIQRLKIALKKFRQATAPLRHPWREIQRTIETGLWKALQQGHSDSSLVQGETALVLDHLVRELVRLQQRIEVLQETIDQIVPEQGKTAFADKIESSQSWHETSSRLKAG